MNNTAITISGVQFSFDETQSILTDANGRTIAADVKKISECEYSVIIDRHSHHFFVTRMSVPPAAVINNYFYEIQNESLRERLSKQLQKESSSHSSTITVRAPMPGLITKILKADGSQIIAGEGIIVIEAMKMENEIKSPKAGIVKKLFIKEKQTVEKNDNLFIIE